jgi:hypothetical protein
MKINIFRKQESLIPLSTPSLSRQRKAWATSKLIFFRQFSFFSILIAKGPVSSVVL